MQEIFNFKRFNIQNGLFKGTIFRFPLRNTKHSNLSSTQYTVERLKRLCEQIEREAHLLMLFLKNVHTVEVYEKTSNDSTAKLVQQIGLRNERNGDHEKRLEFQKILETRPNEECECSYLLETVYNNYNGMGSTYKWIVTQYYGRVSSCQNQALPLVGLAMPVGETKHPQKGHTFCFLPLPLKDDNLTGFDFHINGYFSVDQSRTHIKWQERCFLDTEQNWNTWLIEDVLPVALWKLVLFAISLQKEGHLPVSEVYGAMPDSSKVKKNWCNLAERFWEKAQQNICLYIVLGNWEIPYNCYLIPSDEREHHDLIETVCKNGGQSLGLSPSHVYSHVHHTGKKFTRNTMQKLLLKSTLSLPESEREEILQYMTREDDQLLIGLELLKVESQQETWVKFSSDSSSLIFLETTEFSKSLLPCTRETFMAACSLSDPMYNILANIARRGGYCLS